MAHWNIVFRSDRLHSEVKCAHERDSLKNGSIIIWVGVESKSEARGRWMLCTKTTTNVLLLQIGMPMLFKLFAFVSFAVVGWERTKQARSYSSVIEKWRILNFNSTPSQESLLLYSIWIQASSLFTRFRKSLSKILFRPVRWNSVSGHLILT